MNKFPYENFSLSWKIDIDQNYQYGIFYKVGIKVPSTTETYKPGGLNYSGAGGERVGEGSRRSWQNQGTLFSRNDT